MICDGWYLGLEDWGVLKMSFEVEFGLWSLISA